MTGQANKIFLILAGLNAGLAFGHTQKGLDQFKHPSLAKLPPTLRSASKIGWFEGSVFFAIMGLLNAKWAQSGVLDLFDQGVIGLYVALLFGAGTGYTSTGDAKTGLVLVAVGVLQAVAALYA